MNTIKVQICFGTHCTMMGAMDIMESVNELQPELPEGTEVEVEAVKCFECRVAANAPIVTVNGERIMTATADEVLARIMGSAK
jgi:NADH:ubiquinone oxidoreductase subunit E